ncbi:MAG: hypothetical protein J6A92_07670 [Lachnospiraceae bacterium]|nr:hypothetical protein [Lachnospiraceae bacterium]
MKPEELTQTIMKMCKDTQEGKLSWRIDVQTTEGNEKKYVVSEDGMDWTVDECYVSYLCKYRGQEFCLITYELIKTADKQVKTNNYVFLPPLGVRRFSLQTLLHHSIDADAMMVSQIHALWEVIMGLVKVKSPQVDFHITEASVSIEEDEKQP